MSPELKSAVHTLVEKASQEVGSDPQSIIDALRAAGATTAAKTLEEMVKRDAEVRAEALAEADLLQRKL